MVPREAHESGRHGAIASVAACAFMVGAGFSGPMLGPLVELGSAAVSGAIAAHAVGDEKRVRRGVRRMLRSADAPLAVHALDVALRARRRDPRVLRSVATLVGRCATQHGPSMLAHVTLGWCRPFAALGLAASALEAAQDGADLVRDLKRASTERDPIAIESAPVQPANDDSADACIAQLFPQGAMVGT
jgi:hypothetical protein